MSEFNSLICAAILATYIHNYIHINKSHEKYFKITREYVLAVKCQCQRHLLTSLYIQSAHETCNNT